MLAATASSLTRGMEERKSVQCLVLLYCRSAVVLQSAIAALQVGAMRKDVAKAGLACGVEE